MISLADGARSCSSNTALHIENLPSVARILLLIVVFFSSSCISFLHSTTLSELCEAFDGFIVFRKEDSRRLNSDCGLAASDMLVIGIPLVCRPGSKVKLRPAANSRHTVVNQAGSGT